VTIETDADVMTRLARFIDQVIFRPWTSTNNITTPWSNLRPENCPIDGVHSRLHRVRMIAPIQPPRHGDHFFITSYRTRPSVLRTLGPYAKRALTSCTRFCEKPNVKATALKRNSYDALCSSILEKLRRSHPLFAAFRVNGHQNAPILNISLVQFRIMLRNAHADKSSGKGSGHRAGSCALYSC
jgi:hypothetical protein